MENEKKWEPGGNAREGSEPSAMQGVCLALRPMPKTSTKGSGNFTHALAAGGIQHEVEKLSSAIKECLLTFYNLTIVTLFWSRLLKLRKPN